MDKPSLADCPKCGAKKMMHKMCDACGFYKNREVVDVLKKTHEKKGKKEEGKEEEKKPLTMENLSKKEK